MTPGAAFCAGVAVGFFVFVGVARFVIWRWEKSLGPKPPERKP